MTSRANGSLVDWGVHPVARPQPSRELWGWDAVHARYRLAADVLRDVARTGEGTQAERHLNAIEEVFGDFGTFLLHLQRRWYTTLQARLDAALESSNGDADLPTQVARVWTQMKAVDPDTRAVLDEYADHPDLRAGEVRQRRILGVDRLQ